MKERIRIIRKKHNLTQAVFGEKVGVGRDTITNWELGRSEPPETVIRLICREFNVDYGWLKNGDGEMYASEDEEFQAAIDDLMTGENETAKAFLRTLAKLNDSQWEVLEQMLAIFEKERGN